MLATEMLLIVALGIEMLITYRADIPMRFFLGLVTTFISFDRGLIDLATGSAGIESLLLDIDAHGTSSQQ